VLPWLEPDRGRVLSGFLSLPPLGIAIPALVYSLTRVGAALYVDCNTRTA
jgi:hypothetical protein